ncbi:MAG: hypothetical protein FD134_1272 [Gallionellaceae bacterium]|nr:MAG: hypothetical protein FD134_1272 [Gallionellaceae bacterium]
MTRSFCTTKTSVADIPFKQIIGRPYYDIFPKTDGPLPCCTQALETAEKMEAEVGAGDATYRSRTFSIHDEQGAYLYSVHVLEDITGRKRAEEQAAKEREKFHMLFDAISDAVAIHNMEGRFLQANRSACEHFGYSQEELLQKNVADIDTPEFAAKVAERIKVLYEQGHLVAETAHLRKDGSVIPVELNARVITYDGQPAVLSVARDITERKRAEQELVESRQRAQHYLDIADVMLISLDTQGRVQMVNRKGCEMLGHPEADILGKDWFDNYLPESARNVVRRIFAQIMDGDIVPVEYFENNILTASGAELTVAWHNSLLEDETGKAGGLLSSGEDITARKQAENTIQHANRALATLGAVNRALVRATDESELLQAICNAIVGQRGYRMAWVGYVQHDAEKSVKIMACAGEYAGYLDTMRLTWAETERGMGPSGRAIRSGKPQLCQDMACDPLYLPWRDEALKRGYAASLALPLLGADQAVFGILNVYSGEVKAFVASEVALLEEMADDLAFGVRTLNVRRERDLALEQGQRHFARLHKSMEDTVQAIANMVEMRDPYTAGHQGRVAGLAAAIARQMGLPEDRIHGIHLAGVVHDLGKIQVPAEILSKPGKISSIEHSLIKAHPQAGFDILKDIEFPWPIAQMVLQHHERLDGSGYPQGLKGEQIILEARILNVADVVEAISSHRPYRPGLGVDAALEEITRQCGTHYDAAVVNACLALFREQHYKFQPASF